MLKKWSSALEEREEKISRKKTEYERWNEHNDKDTVTETVKTFKYLASTLVCDGMVDEEFNHKGQRVEELEDSAWLAM